MKAMIIARRFGILGAVLLAIGAMALWIVADDNRAAASAPAPVAMPLVTADPAPVVLAAPPAPSAVSREAKRFSRADRDDDGLVSQGEYLSTRKRNYDRLDTNADGRLSFEEYAAAGISKFATADSDGSGTLAAREYASTAPKPKRPVQTAAAGDCPPAELAAADINS